MNTAGYTAWVKNDLCFDTIADSYCIVILMFNNILIADVFG